MTRNHTIYRHEYGWEFGPLKITRAVSDERAGWVLFVEDESGERVEIRTSWKGRSGMTVNHVYGKWSDG